MAPTTRTPNPQTRTYWIRREEFVRERVWEHDGEAGSMREITDFIDSLARAEMPRDDLVNIYQDSVRRENLTRWLKRLGHQQPAVLLVGEAPGKKGAAMTGVPFVSPDVLMRGPKGGDPWSAFGTEAGYQYADPSREGTATMFWK